MSVSAPSPAAAKIGQPDQWLYIQTVDGQQSWVAAWHVEMLETTA